MDKERIAVRRCSLNLSARSHSIFQFYKEDRWSMKSTRYDKMLRVLYVTTDCTIIDLE